MAPESNQPILYNGSNNYLPQLPRATAVISRYVLSRPSEYTIHRRNRDVRVGTT